MPCDPSHREIDAPSLEAEDPLGASRAFLRSMATRRTIRDFSPSPVEPELVRNAIATAATAPSGANVQPWRFVVVTDPELKRRIREGAEEEERAFYEGRHEWPYHPMS